MEHSKHEAKTHTKYNNSLHESRFKVLLFIFRMGGIPIKVNSASRLNALYKASLIVCFYITYFCACAHFFFHTPQLTIAMKNIRIVFLFHIGVWLHFGVR